MGGRTRQEQKETGTPDPTRPRKESFVNHGSPWNVFLVASFSSRQCGRSVKTATQDGEQDKLG